MQSSTPNVLSVPQLMKTGFRILMNCVNVTVFTEQPHIQVAPSFAHPKVPVSVVRVRVSSVDRSNSVIVNALFSTAAKTSSISEPLAERLGIEKGNSIVASDFSSNIFSVPLPSSHVDVECMDVVCTTGETVIPKSTRVAFLIVPNPGNDMVLGNDWFVDLAERTHRGVVLDYAPDKSRLRFLPPGEVITTQEGMYRFAEDSNIDEGDFIVVPWARPDPGPGFDPSPASIDMTHHVHTEVTGRTQLDAIRDAD
mgnify:FL=1